ncbi:MAG: GDP-mannose 4,6-dehydratase, partial [Candidatus Omnitrophica bacterium]|nr:GDP-mannose 4,6-dehydratase [Candidatus Omnitrophota bacterium]
PTEVEQLRADTTKAKRILGWEPKTTFDELIKIMVDYDMRLIGLQPIGEGIELSGKKGFSYTNHDFSLVTKAERT